MSVASFTLAVILPELGALSETFLQRHVFDLLPGNTVAIVTDQEGPTYGTFQPRNEVIYAKTKRLPEVTRLVKSYGIRAILSEYLDSSLPWLDLAVELGIPFFGHAHGYDVSARLQEHSYRSAYLRYDGAADIITMSEYSKARLTELGLRTRRIHVVPYGVNVPVRRTDRTRSSHVRALAVGRLVPKKAPLSTLGAFELACSEVPNMTLDLIGDGPLTAAVSDRIKGSPKLAPRVTFHGPLNNAAVLELMQSADIFLQHSVTDPQSGDSEGLPVAILEAMAAGLPVVTTNHTGIPEAVEDGRTGFLVPEGDIDAMADRIALLSGAHTLREVLGRCGWQRARARFSWSRERDELLRIMNLAPASSAENE